MKNNIKMLQVKDLKKALKNIPDNVYLSLSSDSGVDQGFREIIVQDCYYNKYTNKFVIYCNDIIEEEDENAE